jgi:Transport and Golgi organisation 2
MCTVTVVPHETGVRVMCNRDERRSRPAALPPQVHDLGGRLAAFPVDPRGGGSWVGVNDAGIIVTLLNVSGSSRRSPEEPRQSRGLIVREMLRCGSLSHVLETVASLDVGLFDLFRLVVAQGSTVVDATTDGVRSVTPRQIRLDTPLIFTSSSLGDSLVEAPRQQLFQRMVVEAPSGWLRGQRRFHRHQWPSRPEISVRMERHDALTVSRTVVEVTRARRTLFYEAPVTGGSSREVREWCFLH